ncbi:MAG TPA: M20/M25/M40 family metallo-hydrolase [Ktedonobacterales bacterium]
MPDALLDYLDQHRGEAQALLERLCRQPSVAAQDMGMAEMANLVESLLQETGFATRRLAIEGAPPLIYGELHGTGPYTLLLYDHYDVQPPEPLDLWQSPPFDPTVRDGRLYARGTSDDKGEIAARLSAIRALRAIHGDLPITLKWIIEGEEEIGSPHFEDIILPHAALLAADACLWEGSGFDPTGRPRMVLGSKGLLYVQLDVRGTGKDAHSGSAPILPSAAWRLVSALSTLRAPDGRVLIGGFYDDVVAPTPAQITALEDQPDMDDELREAYKVDRFNDGLTGLALRQRLAFTPTCNIAGLVSGYTGHGSKTVLPAHAMCKIDFRLVPEQRPDDIAAKLRTHLDAHGFDDIQITIFANAEPITTPLDHPFVRRVGEIARSFADKPPSIFPLMGGTLPLLGALRRHVGVPGLSAPGDPVYWANDAHSPNEHIRLADLDTAVRFNCHLFQHIGAS